MRQLALSCLFFLSGVSALIYELLWQRLLSLTFGVSTLCVSAVIASFMIGLALGGVLMGRWADRSERPLHLYAAIEAVIALAGLTIPSALALAAGIQNRSGLGTNPTFGTLHLWPMLASFGVLCVPTTLMGATVPLMGRLVASSSRHPGSFFCMMYGANTLGGVVGAALTGFVLLRVFGMRQTLWLAMVLNLAAAGLALAIARSNRFTRSALLEIHGDPEPNQGTLCLFASTLIAACALLTGAVSTGLEVAWARVLGILTSNSAYGFAQMLTVVLLGLVLGSLLSAWWSRRSGDAWIKLGLCQGLLAGVNLALMPNFRSTPQWVIGMSDRASPGALFLGELLLTAATLLAPSVLMGTSLPLLASMIRNRSHFGLSLGRLYAINTLGCALGPFLVGFWLIPRLGIHSTLGVQVAVSLLVATIACMLARQPAFPWRLAGAFAVLIAAGLAWNLIPPGRYFKSPVESPRKLLYYAEGDCAIVAVVEESNGVRTILVDGQPVAGTAGTSVVDQKMLAHLPLLLHPNPRRALTVGFGSGGTSYSMSLHGIDVDCVEIERCVPGASEFFLSENHEIIGQPHFRLIVDDARAWLHAAPEPYDVIVTDCTNIQYRSNGDLYTSDYFRLMREQLTEQGVAAAWVPANGIREEDLKTLLRSIQAVFPHTSVWYMNMLPTDFLIVVGTQAPLSIDLADWSARMRSPGVYADLAAVGITDPRRLVFTLLTADEPLRQFLADGPLNSDDRPVLSYSTYGACYRSTIAANLVGLLASRVDPAQFLSEQDNPVASLRTQAASNEAILGHLALWAGDPATAMRHYALGNSLLPDDFALRQLTAAVANHQKTR
jgi:spermidine synthase